jgi:hypothetical protein
VVIDPRLDTVEEAMNTEPVSALRIREFFLSAQVA